MRSYLNHGQALFRPHVTVVTPAVHETPGGHANKPMIDKACQRGVARIGSASGTCDDSAQ